MERAIKLGIGLGLTPATIDVCWWARTYPPATLEQLRIEWDRQLSEKSLRPTNQYECDK
jgi:hypothetical protein